MGEPTASDEDRLREALEKIIPKSLDDVVRRNRDKMRIGRATLEEIARRMAAVEPEDPRDTLEEWRIIAFRTEAPFGLFGDGMLLLLGYATEARASWITSEIQRIDFDRRLVRTRNSVYRLGTPGQGEPPTEDLAVLCAVLHEWGVGDLLGAPHFFF